MMILKPILILSQIIQAKEETLKRKLVLTRQGTYTALRQAKETELHPNKRHKAATMAVTEIIEGDKVGDQAQDRTTKKHHYPEKGPLINMTKQKLPNIAKVLSKTVLKNKKPQQMNQKGHGERIRGWYH